MRTTIIIVSVLAIGLGIYFFFRKREAKDRQDAIERLYKTVTITGSDIVKCESIDQLNKTIKGGTASEINQFTDLLIKGERDWTAIEKELFESLWTKMTGIVIPKLGKAIPI